LKEIELSRGKIALVDGEDYDMLATYKWYAMPYPSDDNRWFAMRELWIPERNLKTTVRMHRAIMQPPAHLDVDHRNGNGLDNRRSNLRVATRAQNMQNSHSQVSTSSRYKGVSWRKDIRKWDVRIVVHGRQIFLGHFRDELDAALAYDGAARVHFGEFARLNIPKPGEQSASDR
jgi:hypothetical protein